jgi:hypothetical protein
MKQRKMDHAQIVLCMGTLSHVDTNSQTFNTLSVKFSHVELRELKSIACSTNL